MASSVSSDEAENESVIGSVAADEPAVFMCSTCRLPVADSGDCLGSIERENIYVMKAVSENVEIDAEKSVSSYEMDLFSTVQVLFCKGCSSSLGAFYVSTPTQLDYKRERFIFNTSALTCYFFDNPNKVRARENKYLVNLPNVAYMEEQLEKCRMVFGSCERMVEELESKLLQSSETS